MTEHTLRDAVFCTARLLHPRAPPTRTSATADGAAVVCVVVLSDGDERIPVPGQQQVILWIRAPYSKICTTTRLYYIRSELY